MKSKRQIITITKNAAEKIRNLLKKKPENSVGIRLTISTKGCSGLSYNIDYTNEINPSDEIASHEDVSIYIDAKAILFLIGSEMDYENNVVKSGFIFKNPNEKGRCGCGQSFIA